MNSRRNFIKSMIAMTSCLQWCHGSYASPAQIHQHDVISDNVIDWSWGMKPFFCVAYINPGIKSQKNQEKHIAKYPIAIVSQGTQKYYLEWLDRIVGINPKIKLLGYQMVIEETLNPGPGHDILRSAKNAWVTYPDGTIPTVTYRTNVKNTRKRIYDPRSNSWQRKFIDGCSAVLDSYRFDGLFLDQCTVYSGAAKNKDDFRGMMDSLNEALILLRERYPEKIIIGNSKYNWTALNGELNESRPNKIIAEMDTEFIRNVKRLEMFHLYTQESYSDEFIKKLIRDAFASKAFFGCSPNAQNVRWLSVFDDVLKEYSIVEALS